MYKISFTPHPQGIVRHFRQKKKTKQTNHALLSVLQIQQDSVLRTHSKLQSLYTNTHLCCAVCPKRIQVYPTSYQTPIAGQAWPQFLERVKQNIRSLLCSLPSTNSKWRRAPIQTNWLIHAGGAL